MNKLTIIRKSLIYYRNAHLRTIAGLALSSAILLGGLIIGDSVRLSLQQMVTNRLGKTVFALESGDRYFTLPLAKRLSSELNTIVSPVLQSNGLVIYDDGERKISRVQILGVDERFGALKSSSGFFDDLKQNEIIINSVLAEELAVGKGDELLLRLQKPEFIPLQNNWIIHVNSG